MRIRRALPVVLGLVVVAAAVTLAVQLRKHAPPEPARLLPGADGFAYLDLAWVRRANVAGQIPQTAHDPEYQKFIDQTGFQFERDLDEVAVAIHFPPASTVPASAAKDAIADATRFSEVFVGRIDGKKLRDYLRGLSSSVETYNGVDIYVIPLEGRTVRAAILTVDTVAVTNHSDPLVIRGMIDRSHKLASPFGGPALLRQYYRRVPLASLAWAIVRADPTGALGTTSPINWGFLFSKPAVVVASARYLGNVHVRAEAFTGSPEEAQTATDRVQAFVGIFRAAEISSGISGGSDPDMQKLFDSVKIEQSHERAVLTAILPVALLRKVFEQSPLGETGSH